MNNNTTFIAKDGNFKITASEILTLAAGQRTIELIKTWRQITNDGLKDSKDKIESFRLYPENRKTDTWGNAVASDYTYDIPKMLAGFKAVSKQIEMTKEEFINMVGEAIDNMSTFHCTDMLDAIEFMIKGIRSKGGLPAIAEERDNFLEQNHIHLQLLGRFLRLG